MDAPIIQDGERFVHRCSWLNTQVVWQLKIELPDCSLGVKFDHEGGTKSRPPLVSLTFAQK